MNIYKYIYIWMGGVVARWPGGQVARWREEEAGQSARVAHPISTLHPAPEMSEDPLCKPTLTSTTHWNHFLFKFVVRGVLW